MPGVGLCISSFIGKEVGQRYGPELHTDANAASDPNGNEANATTGWNQANLDLFESQASVVHDGSYALHANANGGPANGAQINKTFTVENGETYLIEFWWRHVGVGLTWNFNINDGSGIVNVESVTSSDTTFVKVSHEVTLSDTDLVLYFRESSSGNTGGIYLDNFSLRKKL